MPLVLFGLSVLVLTLEVLETKIFAYSLENNLIFVVVAIVLLGFGAGGTLLSLRRELGDPKPLVRRCLWATAVLLVVAHAWFAQVSDRLRFEADFVTISCLVLLASPYLTAGMAISALLADPSGNVQARYGVNLVGSAVGCTTIFFLLGPLTAPQCLIVCATTAGLIAAALSRIRWQAALGVLALGGVLFALADEILPYQIEPAPFGQLALLRDNLKVATEANPEYRGKVRLVERFDRWDPTARVQVHEIQADDPHVRAQMASVPNMWFTQDSSYGSPLIGRGVDPAGAAGFYERTCYGLGYFRGREGPRVLVIGLGGAPDVQAALHHGASRVVGVDINRTTIAMIAGPMAEFTGNPYGDPRVELHVRDGRSWVRSTGERFDLIQLSGVDTKSVLAAGTLAVNESYLYTRPAFAEYLDRLQPDGVLCIVYAGDEYMHRLAITAMDVLRERGAAEPHRHLMLVRQSAIVGVLVKPTPFTEAECEQMERWLAAADVGEGSTRVLITVYELLVAGLSLRPPPQAVWVPGRPTTDPVMSAAVAGTLDQHLATNRLDLRPVPDTRPFFFHLLRPSDVFAAPPTYFRRLFTMIGVMAVLAAIIIAGPLVLFRRRGLLVGGRTLPFALYFALLGAGFIMVEIGFIHRYVLFLGHQAYAFPVVLGGLLVAAGIGSAWSARFERTPHRLIVAAVATTCAALAALELGLDPMFAATAEQPLLLRVGVALAALVPLGMPLGMLFPTGLALVRRSSPLFVPWAFGINGVFSVVGTTLVLPGAILFGFPVMTAVGAGIYVLAALVAAPVARRLAG